MWKRLQYGGDGLPYNYSLFICDSTSDLDDLPKNLPGCKQRCCFGSRAIVVGENKKYILNLSNEWVEDLFGILC